MTDVEVGANIHAEPITVSHAELRPANEDSLFRRQCPACNRGMLLVYRDQVSFMVRNVDRCIHCGQTIVYTDRFIGGEPVMDAHRPPS